MALCARDDLELTAVAICGEDPLTDVTSAWQYFAGRKLHQGNFDPAIDGWLSRQYVRLLRDSIPKVLNYRQLLTRVIRRADSPRPLLDANRYDVFHSPFFPLPSRDFMPSVPRVLTIYDLIACRRPDWMPQEIVQLMQRILSSIDPKRDWVTCISEYTKQDFCEYTGMSPDRVFVTPLAAADHFRPVGDPALIDVVRKKYGIPEGDYFLSLGALQPRKNFTQVIKSFLQLIKQQPTRDLNLVVVGEKAWMYEELLSSTTNVDELRDRLIFTGFIEDDDLSAVYSGARAFVFVSLFEGFGLPVLEAMQCGTPVIASTATAVPEVVGDAGLLVDPYDTDALSNAMLLVLQDEQRALELKKRGFRRSSEFSWSACAERTMNAYRAATQST
ncbi:MAG TPA: glycosyltransferase family 1 protein [Pyrinomonadaceae bacterium]|nr:glycosyltransferase family 1 protein [Pyrinomonadaceae bacterium]